MYGFEEYYEPDEILRDVDSSFDVSSDESVHELTFETELEATEGLSLLMEDVEYPELLFASE